MSQETEIQTAAQQAVKAIASAADAAVVTIAHAADEASKVVANNASQAAKVLGVQQGAHDGDHDLIVELKVKMDDLKVDIREIKDGTAARIDSLEREKLNTRDSYLVLYKAAVDTMFKDHEDRLRHIETNLTRVLTYGTALIIVVGIAEFVISTYIK